MEIFYNNQVNIFVTYIISLLSKVGHSLTHKKHSEKYSGLRCCLSTFTITSFRKIVFLCIFSAYPDLVMCASLN